MEGGRKGWDCGIMLKLKKVWKSVQVCLAVEVTITVKPV